MEIIKQQIKDASIKLNEFIYYIDTPEHPHEYHRKDNGKLLAGVSSISDLAKSKESGNFLAQWKVNETINYIKEHSDKNIEEVKDNYDEAVSGTTWYKVYEEVLGESKYAHKDKGKEATDIGTQIHSILEEYVNNRIENKKFEWNTTKDSIENFFITDFVEWEINNNVQWLASELLVGDLENDIGGRLDGLAMVNGKVTLIDFKAANTIPPSYYIQLAGYALCLESMGIKVEDRLIIRLPKTSKRKVWVDGKYKMIDNKIEFITPNTDWEFDKSAFVNFRVGYKWINQNKLK